MSTGPVWVACSVQPQRFHLSLSWNRPLAWSVRIRERSGDGYHTQHGTEGFIGVPMKVWINLDLPGCERRPHNPYPLGRLVRVCREQRIS